MDNLYTKTFERFVEMAAKAAHEANRGYCTAIGDQVPPPWDQASEAQRNGMKAGVRLHFNSPTPITPEQSHEAWMKSKLDQGWQWGPEKDEEVKLHPNLKPYRELPEVQRAKDFIFGHVVRSFIGDLPEA
jgi:hypothetical protein